MSLSDELCRSYLDLRQHFDPAQATLEGIAGFDHQLGQFDAASVRQHLAAFRALEAGIEELDAGDAAEEIDRTALLDDVRVMIFRLQHERPHEQSPAFWMLHLCRALQGLLRHEGGVRHRGAAATARLAAVPAFLAAAEKTLEAPAAPLRDIALSLTGPAADLATRLVKELGRAMEDGGAALERAAADGEAAIARFRLALDTDLSLHADERAAAVGEDQFDRLLHHQHALTPGAPELWRTLIRMEEQTEAELRKIARRRDGGSSWTEQLRQLAQQLTPWVDPGASAIRELERVNAFLEHRDLIRPVVDGLTTDRMPAWLELVTCHAQYVASPADATRPAMLWLGGGRSTQLALSPLVVEAGFPGIHLQAMRAREAASEVRRSITSPLLRGGWGLYAVELLDEAGFWPDPAEQLIVKAHLLLRVLLARADIGLHTHQMAMADAARLLLERLPLTPQEAIAAVRHLLLEPTEAVGAVAGRNALLDLRADRKTQLGSRFTLLGHHDSVLGYGCLPVTLVRWGMDA